MSDRCGCDHVNGWHTPASGCLWPTGQVANHECPCTEFTPAPPSLPDRDEAERAWEAWNAQPENKWPSDGYTHMGFLAGFRAAAKEDDRG